MIMVMVVRLFALYGFWEVWDRLWDGLDLQPSAWYETIFWLWWGGGLILITWLITARPRCELTPPHP